MLLLLLGNHDRGRLLGVALGRVALLGVALRWVVLLGVALRRVALLRVALGRTLLRVPLLCGRRTQARNTAQNVPESMASERS